MKTILLTIFCLGALQAQTGDTKAWDRKAAAVYLDERMNWWETWAPAARDHETFCISCHTSLPYALARPALRSALGEQSPSPEERKFVDNISRRVSLWQEVQPYYTVSKTNPSIGEQSRDSEAVMNALVLASYQAPAATDALREMWALQLKTGEKRGSWIWMNFHNEPWEADDSAFWGASLAGLAAGMAPEAYRNSAAIQENIALLGGYMQREQQTQSPLNRAVALWAAGKLPRLLKPEQRAAIVREIAGLQRADGGWSASALVAKDWKRTDGTAMGSESDGYGTGLMVTALEQSGESSAKGAIDKGRAWLERHQDPSGAWLSTSMNKQRDPDSDIGRFMNDAATAYSVLALSGR